MNAVLTYHKGVYCRKEREQAKLQLFIQDFILNWISALEIIIKNNQNYFEKCVRKRIAQISPKTRIEIAQNLVESGDIKKPLKKNIEDSKRSIK